jgi:hypothetical protein
LEIDTGVDYDVFSLSYDPVKEQLHFIGNLGCSAADSSQWFVVFLRNKSRFINVPGVQFQATACVPVTSELARSMSEGGT